MHMASQVFQVCTSSLRPVLCDRKHTHLSAAYNKRLAMQGSALAQSPGAQLIEKATACRDDPAAFASLLLPQVDLVMRQTEGLDTECCLSVLCHTVASVQPLSSSLKLALQLCEELMSDTTHRETARVAFMLELFNTLASAELKMEVLTRVLEYARSTNCAKLAPSLYNKAEAWEQQWQLRYPPAAR